MDENKEVPRITERDAAELVESYKRSDKFNDFKTEVGRFTRFSKHEVWAGELENFFQLMYTMEQDILKNSAKEDSATPAVVVHTNKD